MIPTHRRPMHPGTMLKELYLIPRGITVTALSDATDISRKHLSRLIHGHVGVTPETAMKLSAALETSPELWLNAQRNVDLYDAREELDGWTPREVFAPDDTTNEVSA